MTNKFINDKLLLAVKVARMYYECNDTQQEISKKLQISRPQVSRLLQLARDEGIVEIRINSSLNLPLKLENLLQQKFGLKKAIVVPMTTDDLNKVKENLARVTSNYLDEILEDGQVIGIPWGSTLSYVAEFLRERRLKNLTIVQLKGGVGRVSGNVNTYNPVITFALKLNATPYFLPVPSIVENLQIKEILLSDGKIKEIIDLAVKADVAIYPIGRPAPASALVQAGYFTAEQMVDLQNRGAVGDIYARYFNIEGKVFDQELNNRTIAIELEKIKEKKYAIAIAGGKEYANGILGALRGGYLNVLITDEVAAKEVLRKAGIDYND
ncbi:sugar-binding transcriptional regulator [Alkaliphilus hydrothermalis]|uniref:Deoxyribonucleoside regulator n=1 Tax=Alkaliphilus hydrothermalis TaxID=1482730 RepID=A0ABS2NM74_9FIRM|nr:sugar-binding transcriptional regulator [Alkaliphilus hydrothermalis]MBM7614048.1 deoxyribonucleoside regulator [Alkaliphilus hydrothermalis]